jgi:hypothetical protein
VVNALLPSHPGAPGEVSTQPGEDIERRLDARAHRLITTLGREAETAFNQNVPGGQDGNDLPNGHDRG